MLSFIREKSVLSVSSVFDKGCKEAIVLAGGLGTRLQHLLKDIPKPMADISGQPFLAILLHHLEKQGINSVILSAGHKHKAIKNYFGTKWRGIEIKYAIEQEPLGTGGAMKLALDFTDENNVLVVNGDTFFDVKVSAFCNFHMQKKAMLSLALKPLKNFDRYGTVTVDATGRITGFKEKQLMESGFINGGVYLLNKNIFDGLNLPDKFSFEKDFLEKFFQQKPFYGKISEGYFLDIGIPEDYARAQHELEKFKH